MNSTNGSAPFGEVRLATVAPARGATPDPATFTLSYGPSAPAFVVEFELRRHGRVTFTATMSMGSMPPMAVLAAPLSGCFDPGWHYFEVASAAVWPVGEYSATMTFGPTGQTVSIAIPVR